MGKKLNLIGKKFNRLTILEETNKRDVTGGIIYKCLCDCGEITYLNGSNVFRGKILSCGCTKLKYNLTNKKYGDLIVLERAKRPKYRSSGVSFWKCKCVCGQITIKDQGELLRGNTVSCGCKTIENLSKAHLGKGIINMIGKRIGKLIVLKQEGIGANNKIKYRCKCDCGNEITTLGSSLRRKSKAVRQCYKCSRINAASKISGSLNYLWKPSLTNEDRERRDGSKQSQRERLWRIQIFQRDKHTCQLCYKKSGFLNAHHLNSYSDYKDLRYDIKNGICLCKSCHYEFHKFYGLRHTNKTKFISYLNYKGNTRCQIY